MIKRSSVLSLLAIAAVLLLGVGYLVFGILRVDPREDYKTATIVMRGSGGLAVTSPVLLTGYEIGDVTALKVSDEGVEATIRYRSDFPIPLDSDLAVETLSALGEPYINFTPRAVGGTMLTDGQRVDARDRGEQRTISDTAASATAMLDQLDPGVIAELVDTFNIALDGTDAVMPRLQRSTRLLAETLMARNPQLADLLVNLQKLGGDIDWLGPALHEGGPAWAQVGATIITPLASEMSQLAEKRDPTVYTTGDGLIPFLGRLNDLLVELGPSLKPLTPMLTPVVDDASNSLAHLDLAELVSRALKTVGPDNAVHLQLDVAPPGGP